MTQQVAKKHQSGAQLEQASSGWIPNINIAEDYDRRYIDASIHYESIDNLAGFFGRDIPIHRHAQHFQIHYIETGDINFHIDDKLFQVKGPGLFFIPPAIPHSFQILKNTDGHVLTIRQSIIWDLMKKRPAARFKLNLNRGICLTGNNMEAEQKIQWQLIQQLLGNINNEWLSNSTTKQLVLEILFIYSLSKLPV